MSRTQQHATGVRTVIAAFAAALFTSAVTGCSSPATDGDRPLPDVSAPAVADIPQLDTAAELSLPLEKYLFSDAEMSTLMRARQMLVERCMKDLGIDYTAPGPQAHVGPKSRTERRYGLADPEQAAEDGYHMPGAEVKPEPELPPEQYRALTGIGAGEKIPEGGCTGEAERGLAGDDKFGTADLAQDLNGRSYTLSQQDKRVKSAFRAWSSCMAKDGYEYPDPMKAMSAPEFSQNKAGKGEAATAVADVRCKHETNLVGIWYTVESAYQRQLIEETGSEMEAIGKAKKAQLEAARKIADGA